MQFVALFAELEIDIVDLLVSPAKGTLERREQLDPLKRLCFSRPRESQGNLAAGKTQMQGGGVVKGPIEVFRPAPSGAPILGHGRPGVPQIMSQMITPSTRLLRLIISALSRVELQRTRYYGAGRPPELVQRLPGDEFLLPQAGFELVRVLTVQTSLQVDDGEAATVSSIFMMSRCGPRRAARSHPFMRPRSSTWLGDQCCTNSRLPRMVSGIFAANLLDGPSEYRANRETRLHQVHEFQACGLEFSKPLQTARSRREAAGLACAG